MMTTSNRYLFTLFFLLVIGLALVIVSAGPVFIVFEDGSYQWFGSVDLSGCLGFLSWGCE
jgi:hypothetical protein